jgi:hypothetical protein
MGLRRILAMTDIIIRGHIFVPLWWSRERRREKRCRVLTAAIPRYFKRYLPAVADVPECEVIHDDKNEKIWTIWQQGEDKAPPLVKACFRNIRKHCKQELVVLDDTNIFDYITLPQEIIDKYKAGKIKRAHFADICRVELLYEHGGFWLDSTGFATSEIPQWIVDQDFFVYMAGQNVGSPYSYMQNCFIRARKGAYLLAAWRAMILDYWKKENHNFDYFMHQLLFKTLVENDERAKKYFAKMPHVDQDPTHALWWAYGDKKFDKKVFDKVTSGAFFQKTTYNSPWAKNIIPGSFADEMINKM